jgi:hypothetical protein
VADQFDVPESRDEFAGKGWPQPDRWGRYKLPDPEVPDGSGKVKSWTRATTFAKSISDTFALSQWSQRMVAKGMTLRPDLLAMMHSLDVKADKDKVNQLCEDAKSAAGNKVAANLGTALHSFSERIDAGTLSVSEVPEAHRDDLATYAAAMAATGLRVVPGMIERQVVVPGFDIGGTFDRILGLEHCPSWFLDELDIILGGEQEVIGDVKTGQDLQYGWNEIALQLLTYAMGVKTAGTWNRATQSWDPPRPVRQDFAIVMHMPVGQGVVTIYQLDLTEAAWAMELCRDVRKWRKMRNLAKPLHRVVANEEPPPVAMVESLSWLDRFGLAGSRGELSALFKDAVAAGEWSDTLKQAGLDRLKILEEKAG